MSYNPNEPNGYNQSPYTQQSNQVPNYQQGYNQVQQYQNYNGYNQPYQTYYNQQPQYQYQNTAQYASPTKENNGLVLGILSIVLGIFLSLAGWILGGIGLAKSRKNVSAKTPIVLNIIGLIVSTISFVILIIFLFSRGTSGGFIGGGNYYSEGYGNTSQEEVIKQYWKAVDDAKESDAVYCFPYGSIDEDDLDFSSFKDIDIKYKKCTSTYVDELDKDKWIEQFGNNIDFETVELWSSQCPITEEDGDSMYGLAITLGKYKDTWFILEAEDDGTYEAFNYIKNIQNTEEASEEQTTESSSNISETTEEDAEEITEETTEGEQSSDNKIGNSTVGFLSVDYDMTEDDEFTANYGNVSHDDAMEYVTSDDGLRIIMFRFSTGESAKEAIDGTEQGLSSTEADIDMERSEIELSDGTLVYELTLNISSDSKMIYYYFDIDGHLYHIELMFTEEYAENIKEIIKTFEK